MHLNRQAEQQPRKEKGVGAKVFTSIIGGKQARKGAPFRANTVFSDSSGHPPFPFNQNGNSNVALFLPVFLLRLISTHENLTEPAKGEKMGKA
jgi:hypothetical protein